MIKKELEKENRKLKRENYELRESLEILSDTKLMKKINRSFKDIKEGKVLTSEELFKTKKKRCKK